MKTLYFLVIGQLLALSFLCANALAAPQGTAEFIAKFEGFRNCAYLDPSGSWFINGYGTTAKSETECISEIEALARLKKGISGVEKRIDKFYGTDFFLPHEKIAIISFGYNTPQTFPITQKKSLTLAVMVRDEEKLRKEFLHYAPFRGNVIRRNAEVDLFFSQIPNEQNDTATNPSIAITGILQKIFSHAIQTARLLYSVENKTRLKTPL